MLAATTQPSAPAPAAPLPSPRAMYRALLGRDPSYQGVFVAGIVTTGIFCRPTCRAKKPRPENVRYFPSVGEALHDGFRPCRLCRPLERVEGPPPVVAQLLELAEADPGRRLRDADLAALGIDPSTARRRFKAATGMTFQAYQRARRLGLALRQVRRGRPVIEAQLDVGYESGSGFRAAFTRLFGQAPAGARRTACLTAQRIATPLGTMLALADEEGLRLLEFVDRRGLERELQGLRRRLRCAVVPGRHATLDAAAEWLERYFAGQPPGPDLPLAPVGSPFQRAVWRALREIPAGQTRGYAELARAIGRPGASRAVGRANGANALAIVIPCHRVVGADGALTGYGGGLWRKQRLLDLERAASPGACV